MSRSCAEGITDTTNAVRWEAAQDYPLLNLFWTMLWLFLWILWIFLVIRIVMDVFRSDDLGGGAKALWTIFIIVLPFLGILVYLIARGSGMYAREAREARARPCAPTSSPQRARQARPRNSASWAVYATRVC
jgi:ABC-type Fe3+ transport system permease subunit